MSKYASDIAFTPVVKAIQTEKGSRSAYAKMEQRAGWQTKVTPDLEGLLSQLDMFYLGTSNSAGQPYIQYRGGPPGFLKVIDETTLGFADFSGNQQYITLGNLSENPKAFIFLMDYANRRRVKLWGTAHTVEDNPRLIQELSDNAYAAKVERAILFEIAAWDVNCPQHIHRRFSEQQFAPLVNQLQIRINDVEAKLAKMEAKASRSMAGRSETELRDDHS